MKRILYILVITFAFLSSLQAETEKSYLEYCTETVLEQIYHNDSLIQAGDVQNLNFVIDIRYEEFLMVDKLDGVSQLNDRLKAYYTTGYNPKLTEDTKVGIYVILLSKQPPLSATPSYGFESKDQLLAMTQKYDKAKYQQYMTQVKNKQLPGWDLGTQYDQIWVQLCENIQKKLKEKQSITFNNNKGAVLNVTNFVTGRNPAGYPTIGRKASMLFGKKLSNESMLTVLKQTNEYLVGKKPSEYMPLYNTLSDYGFINLFLSGIEAGLNGIKNNPKLPGGANAIADEDGINAENGMVYYPQTGVDMNKIRNAFFAQWNATNKPNGIEKSYKNNPLIKYTDHAGILLSDPTFLDRFFKIQDLSGFSLDQLKTQLPQGILFDDKITYKIIITSKESFTLNDVPTAIQQAAQAKLNNEDAVYIGLHIDFSNSDNVQVYTTCTDKLLQKLKDYREDMGYSWYRNKASGKIVFAQGLQYKLNNFYTEWEVLGKYVATSSDGTKIYNDYSNYYKVYVAVKTYVEVAKPLDTYLESDEFAYIFMEGYAAVLLAPVTGGGSLEAFSMRIIARKAAKDIAVGVALTIGGKMIESYFGVDSIKTLKSAFIYSINNANGQDYVNNIIDEFQEGNPIPQYVNACMGKVHEVALSKAGYENSEIPYDCIEGVLKKMFFMALSKAGGKTFELLKAKIKGDPVTFMGKWKEFYGELTDDHIKSFEKTFGLDFDLKLKISQVTFDLSKYTNLKKAYTGFQSQLGSGYTTFENALKKCNNDVLTAFDNNTALFNKLGNIKDLGETELAERMAKVSKGEDFGALKFNNVLTKFINVSSVSVPNSVNLTGFVSQSSDNLIDIVVHFKDGAYVALVEDAGKFVEKSLSTEDLAEIINKLPADKVVRLLSCNDLASALELSKLINKRTLFASDGLVDLFEDGIIVSENAFKKIIDGKALGDIGRYSNPSLGKAFVTLGEGAIGRFKSIILDASYTSKLNRITKKNSIPQLEPEHYALDILLSDSRIWTKGIENGKPKWKVLSSTDELNFVITTLGELKIGNGHYFMSSEASEVLSAGSLRFESGKIKSISNGSGHYKPSLDELNLVIDEVFKKMGITANDMSTNRFNFK